MLRKSIVSLVLCIALLFIVFSLVSAQGQSQAARQMDMSTPTATAAPEATPTPAADLPLTGDLPLANTQSSGTCPMMNGAGMTGMGNMAGMQGMSGMGMNGMSGNMTNMGGMNGMSGMGMNGNMSGYPAAWYSDPWWLLGWVLLTVVVLAILFGASYGLIQLFRRSKSGNPPAAS